MPNGKDDGIIEKCKEAIGKVSAAIGKVSGAIDETFPKETPDVNPDHTGSEDDVQKLINEVPQDQQAAPLESYKKHEKTRTWRVWDWKLGTLPGHEFEGEIVLKWECDYCYIYKIRAWHHTSINTVPVVPNLKVKTSPADPGSLRLTGYAPCKPVGMRVELHLTLGEKESLQSLILHFGAITSKCYYRHHAATLLIRKSNTKVRSRLTTGTKFMVRMEAWGMWVKGVCIRLHCPCLQSSSPPRIQAGCAVSAPGPKFHFLSRTRRNSISMYCVARKTSVLPPALRRQRFLSRM